MSGVLVFKSSDDIFHNCDSQPEGYTVQFGVAWWEVVDNGDESLIGIIHCPYCGEKLPAVQRHTNEN